MPIELGSFSLGTAVGGAIVGLLNHFLAKSRGREERNINSLNEAAKKFRATTFELHSGLYPTVFEWPDAIEEKFGSILPQMELAVEELKPHIVDSAGFNKAWGKYKQHCKTTIPENCDMANILHGEMLEGKEYSFKKAMKILHTDLNDLLEYAKINR